MDLDRVSQDRRDSLLGTIYDQDCTRKEEELMTEEFYVRQAGMIYDYLVAQGLDENDIAKTIKYLPRHLEIARKSAFEPNSTKLDLTNSEFSNN